MTGRRFSLSATLACAALCVSACTVGPNYVKPESPTPPAYVEATDTARTAIQPADADLSRWWTQIPDSTLQGLIQRALQNNLDLRTAASRVRQARQEEVIAGAKAYPSLSATASAVTLNSNAPAPPPGATPTSPIPRYLNLYAVGFDASWEVDLFGGVRRSVEEARANTEAYRWERRDAEVTLTAEVANDYLTLRAVQARIEVGEGELARQQDLFGLIGARRKAGFVTNLDVNQQSTAVATAAAQIPQLRSQAKSEIHALGVLLGETPEALESELATAPAVLPPPPPTLPTGLPSELLTRRPDIREAERKLAASNAEIGVQTANFYPKLDLTGLGAFASMTPGSLFTAQHLASIGLAQVSQPIFEGGRLRASVRVAREKNVQATNAYRGAVLGALRDVEDALARFKADEDRRRSLAQAVTAATASRQIAQDQYGAGLVTFVNVLQSEYAVLSAEDQLTQADGQSLTDVVALYKALGGGWSS